MALTEGQVSVRGLVMGPGTPYIVQTFQPEEIQARGEQTGRAWAHGAWAGAEFADVRSVSMTITVSAWSAADWDDLHADLKAALAPVGTGPEAELHWVIGGTEYVLFGRPREGKTDTDSAPVGVTPVKATFVALDPVKYSPLVETEPIVAPTYWGGLQLPTELPFHIGAEAVTGQKYLLNAGTVPTGMHWRITGPAVQPRVIITPTTGPAQTWQYTGDIPAGSWLDVDTATRTVLEQGQVSRRSRVKGDWPLLPPGDMVIARFRGLDITDDGASLTVAYRSAWW